MDWTCVLNDPKLISKFSNKDFKEKIILKLVSFSINLCTYNFIFRLIYIYFPNDMMINCNKMSFQISSYYTNK